MRFATLTALTYLIAAPAFAQQPPVDLSIAVQIYAQKLAVATDEAVAAETRVQMLTKQVADLQKQIDDAKPKDAPAP
jgi:hypothetical protein